MVISTLTYFRKRFYYHQGIKTMKKLSSRSKKLLVVAIISLCVVTFVTELKVWAFNNLDNFSNIVGILL
jgi:hypothetical protein